MIMSAKDQIIKAVEKVATPIEVPQTGMFLTIIK
jgi:hypothetical protein